MTDPAPPPSARPSGSVSGAATLVGGKYQVIESLKTGGTALIELAIMRGENNFSREVVLKRPRPDLLADRQLRAMFLDEAHLASRFSHPNVVQVIDLVAREDEVFLVLEHLRGRDLRELIKRSNELGRLIPADITAYIVAESAAGLGYAHDATTPDGQPLNLVHRDVSPKNIRITDAGAVKVIDFGIARADFRQTETAPGSVKGTLGYMSPEQVLGDVVDRRSDVFSLGICLFQMLTGRNPFDGANLQERIGKLIHVPVPRASEVVRDLDPRLDAIVHRSLDRDVDKRYPDMRALRDDLEQYLADQRLASPRQRLVTFLEAIFPDIHQLTPRLQEALSTSSSLSMRGAAELVDAAREAQANAPTNHVAPASIDPRPDTAIVLAPANLPYPSPQAREVNSSWAELPLSVPPLDGDTKTGSPGASELATVTALPKASRVARGAVGAGIAALLIGFGAAAWVISTNDGVSSLAIEPQPPVVSQAPDPMPSTTPAPMPSTTPAPMPSTTPVATPVATVAPTPVPSSSPSETTAAASPSPRVTPKPARYGPRDLLKAGARLARAGQLDDAELLYRLAYARSGASVDPAVFKNLGLLHREQGDVPKLRACFNMYLSRRGGGEDAQKIRALLAGFPAAPSVACVTPGEAAAAEKIAARVGARIEGWVSE